MTWTSLINHLLHFFLPQAFMGLGFVLFEGSKRALKGRQNTTPKMPLYALAMLFLGFLTQMAILYALQKDGTVLGYVLLALVMGLGHFFLTRSWKFKRG